MVKTGESEKGKSVGIDLPTPRKEGADMAQMGADCAGKGSRVTLASLILGVPYLQFSLFLIW